MPSKSLNPTTSINTELANRLLTDEKFRNRFIERWAQAEVAAEIRSMRKRRSLLQGQLATLIGTQQPAVSRIEKAGYDGWTYRTLLGIAMALKSRLRITFEPIEDVAQGYLGLGDDAATNSNVTVYKAGTIAVDFDSINVPVGTSFQPAQPTTATALSHRVN